MRLRLAALALAVLALAGIAGARAPLPPAPTRWVLDEPGLLSAGTRGAIDSELEAFEAKQGSQVLLAIFARLPEGEALEDWTQRVAEGWRVGRAKQDDGVVFFVFVADRQLRIEVGYGLEGALTDVESHRILDETVVPMLRAGDRDGAFRAGMAAILQAIEGEYAPTPRERPTGGNDPGAMVFILVIFAILLLIALSRARSGSGWHGGGPMVGGGGWGGGGFGGGGWSGGGGGFSGGGGSFGGGGASGRW